MDSKLTWDQNLNQWPRNHVLDPQRVRSICAPIYSLGITQIDGLVPLVQESATERKILAEVPDLYKERIRALVHASNCFRRTATEITWFDSVAKLKRAKRPERRKRVVVLGRLWAGAIFQLITAQGVLEKAASSLRDLGCDKTSDKWNPDIPGTLKTHKELTLAVVDGWFYEQVTAGYSDPSRLLNRPDNCFQIPVEWSHNEHLRDLMGFGHTFNDRSPCDGTDKRSGSSDKYVASIREHINEIVDPLMKDDEVGGHGFHVLPPFNVDLCLGLQMQHFRSGR